MSVRTPEGSLMTFLSVLNHLQLKVHRHQREMADFRGAFAAEMEGWAAQEWVYAALWGAAQPAWTLRRGVARWRLDWRL